MNIMSLLKWVINRKKYPLPKKLNIHTISNFAEAELRRFQNAINIFKPEQHIIEQSIWRNSLLKEKCKECYNSPNKQCIKACGCDLNGIIWQTDKHELDCFPEMMKCDTWNNFKITNNIKIQKDGINN
jgi:hypothetical protein